MAIQIIGGLIARQVAVNVVGNVFGGALKLGARAAISGLAGAVSGDLAQLSRVAGGPNPLGIRIYIRGAGGAQAACRTMQRTLDRETKVLLKEATGDVVSAARARALVRTGRLQASIKPYARGSGERIVVGVAASARDPRTGYRYPRLLEYGDGGRRAFLAPALRAHEREFMARAERILDQLADDWARGR